MAAIIAVAVLGLIGVGLFVAGAYLVFGLGAALMVGGAATFGCSVFLRSGIVAHG